jgi:hypothetical protein
MFDCKECKNERYIVMGCCSGRECGCMGQPTSMANCKECNPLATIPMEEKLQEECKYLEYIGFNPELLEVVK